MANKDYPAGFEEPENKRQKWGRILGIVGAGMQDAAAGFNGRPTNNVQQFVDTLEQRRARALQAQAVQGLMQVPGIGGQLSFGAQRPQQLPQDDGQQAYGPDGQPMAPGMPQGDPSAMGQAPPQYGGPPPSAMGQPGMGQPPMGQPPSPIGQLQAPPPVRPPGGRGQFSFGAQTPPPQSNGYDDAQVTPALARAIAAGVNVQPYMQMLQMGRAEAQRRQIESTITDPRELALYNANPQAWAEVQKSQREYRTGDTVWVPGQGFQVAPKLVADNGVYGTQTVGGYQQTGQRGASLAEAETARQNDPNTVGGTAWGRVQTNRNEGARISMERSRLSGETAEVTLTPQTVQQIAETYITTGQLPPLGMGKSAASARQQILNKAGEIQAAGGISGYQAASDRASYKADSSALGQVSKQRNMIESFENTAVKNADLALSLAPKGGAQSKVPVLNRYIQAGRKNIGGDPDVAAFDAALGTFADEYAKVVSGNTGAAGATDAVRAEVRSRINGAMTPAQLSSVIATMKAEMKNRSTSLADQEGQLRESLQSRRPGARQAQPAPAPSSRQANTVYQTPKGPLKWTGTGWVQP